MSIYSMIEAEFSFPEKCYDPKLGKLRDAPWYPLFYRRKDGSILFPAKGLLAVIMQRFDGYAALDGGFA